jgi:integration host factor subunit beta
MLKSELISKISAQNPHLYQRDVDIIVNAILNTITDALTRGDRVELRGFGMFTVKEHTARIGRNPRNGTPVDLADRRRPSFRMSKEMQRRLNPPFIDKEHVSQAAE